MNLQQLRYISEVARNGLNISAAAERLFTSQPGVSKQIRSLEEELGVQIFERVGKQLTRITPAGRIILDMANQALVDIEGIRQAALEYTDPRSGSLSIATTHTHARYILPPAIRRFRERYPHVALHMHQGTPLQIAELLAHGAVDFAIATETLRPFEEMVMLPCYRWNLAVIAPRDHPLAGKEPLALEAIAEYPLLTHVSGFAGRAQVDKAFKRARLTPNIVLSASDSDVIQTYVRLGLGIGIIPRMAHDPVRDADLRILDAGHLFDPSTTRIGFRQGMYLREYMYDFIHQFAPHLTRALVESASHTHSKVAREHLFLDLVLPYA